MLHFDAHADLRDGYDGVKYSHASALRRCLDHENVELVSLGIRNISESEIPFLDANRHRIHIFWGKDKARWNLEDILKPLRGRPIYLTFDVDGLDGSVMSSWGTLVAVRAKVNKQLEEARAASLIGSALAAEVDMYVSDADYDVLTKLGDDLRFVLITSRATVHRAATEAEQRIEVTPSAHTKCERCWHYRVDVGSDAAHPTICGRCVSNLFGDGEARHYA
jgi:hypothetical protein